MSWLRKNIAILALLLSVGGALITVGIIYKSLENSSKVAEKNAMEISSLKENMIKVQTTLPIIQRDIEKIATAVGSK